MYDKQHTIWLRCGQDDASGRPLPLVREGGHLDGVGGVGGQVLQLVLGLRALHHRLVLLFEVGVIVVHPVLFDPIPGLTGGLPRDVYRIGSTHYCIYITRLRRN